MAWMERVLEALGAPASENNVLALRLWAASEGTPDGWNNWLATTRNGFGGVPQNSAGVKAYPNEDQGVAATADTIKLDYYRDVVAAFQHDAGLEELWRTINASPWCSGCQDGRYPIALRDHLDATPDAPAEPADQVPWLEHVSDAVARKGGGCYVLGRKDGGVGAFHGAPFFGSVPQLSDDDRRDEPTEYVALVLHPDEAAYTVFNRKGHGYAFPLGAAPLAWPFDTSPEEYNSYG